MLTKNCELCGKDYAARVSYQIYCGPACRTEATKEKNNSKQRDKRIKSRVGKERLCNTCSKPLSIYNDENFCVACVGDKKGFNKFIRNLF